MLTVSPRSRVPPSILGLRRSIFQHVTRVTRSNTPSLACNEPLNRRSGPRGITRIENRPPFVLPSLRNQECAEGSGPLKRTAADARSQRAHGALQTQSIAIRWGFELGITAERGFVSCWLADRENPSQRTTIFFVVTWYVRSQSSFSRRPCVCG